LPNNLLTRDAATETGLIAQKMADANLTGGTEWVAPVVPESVDEVYPVSLTYDASGSTVLAGADGYITPVRPSAHITKAISYVGDGTVRQLNFGFRPDIVIVKAAGKAAVIFNSEQWNSGIQSFGHTTYSGADALPVPAINDSGVALMYTSLSAAKDSYNQIGVTYHAVAIRDNGAGFLKPFAYNGYTTAVGAGSSPVTMDALDGLSPKWVHIKRDATGAGHEGVWVSDAGYVKKESAAAVNPALVTYNVGGALGLSTDISVNENDGAIIGEAHNCFALLEDATAWEEQSYVGGSGATLSFAQNVALAIILPVAAEEMVFTTQTMAAGATGGATALLSGVVLTNSVLTVNGSAANTASVTYRVIAFYEGSGAEYVDKWPTVPGLSMQAGSGRIVCGTDASLQITGAHSLEWVGSISDLPTEQFIIGRMNGGRGTPVAGTYNFAMAHTRDPDAGLEICTSDQFSQETSNASKQKRWRTGIVLTPFRKYHILYTHDGIDAWSLYVDGVLVKWRRLAMSIFGINGITGTAGLTMAFGGRLASGSYFANTATVHALGRIYNRELTASEALHMYNRNALQVLVPTQSHTDLPDIATSLVEEWKFREGSGTTVVATKNSLNNGTITSASWVRE
jgi:hypothetical protein